MACVLQGVLDGEFLGLLGLGDGWNGGWGDGCHRSGGALERVGVLEDTSWPTVHIIGAVRLGRHVWCSSHGGMVVGKDRVSPDLQVDDVIRSLISKCGGNQGNQERVWPVLF